MTELYILRPDQHAQWMEVLEHSFQYDFYHLPSYHALAEERGEGRAQLFVYAEGQYLIAIPLLLRPIDPVPRLARIGEEWWDATSVYGYAGPIASHAYVPASVLRNFRAALHENLQECHIVTAFSRLHPIIPQHGLLSCLGECENIGKTVSIDLSLPVDAQRAQYRRSYKNTINRLIRLDVTCIHDQNRIYLDDFIDIYYETMRRVHAHDDYFFDHVYFRKLTSILESHVHLFVCLLENKVICGGLFTLCDSIVQYHLGGTLTEFLELSPMKLLIDTVRLWANECGAHVFHLGGGVGSQADSLFHFKVGFSDRNHEFAIWRWVLLPDIYEQLCKEKAQWNERNGLRPVSSKYFPAYRGPSVPIRL
jgi:hypothetical protein